MSQCQLTKPFVTRLNFSDRHWIDAAANGSILELGIEESYELIQKIARNNYDSEFGKNDDDIRSPRDVFMTDEDQIRKRTKFKNCKRN